MFSIFMINTSLVFEPHFFYIIGPVVLTGLVLITRDIKRERTNHVTWYKTQNKRKHVFILSCSFPAPLILLLSHIKRCQSNCWFFVFAQRFDFSLSLSLSLSLSPKHTQSHTHSFQSQFHSWTVLIKLIKVRSLL